MVIIVTGLIDAGKTTLCQKLIGIVQNQGYTCAGILSHKDRNSNILIEDIQTGERETLASTKNVYHGPRTSKYFFNPEGIDFGIKAIDEGINSDILLVDEIGHLELRGEGFVRIIELIKTERVRNCILVVRKELLPEFLPQLKTNPVVFETNADNREGLPQEIYTLLHKRLAGDTEGP